MKAPTERDIDPIRVGIIGLGRSGWDIHVKGLRQFDTNYTITAAFDPSDERRAEAKHELGCKTYAKYEDLLRDPSVEAVVITSPNRFHADQSITALGIGKHVICEKPIALCSAEAKAMLDAAERNKRLLAPFHNRRYEAHFQCVRSVIESGVLGEVQLIRLAHHHFTRRWDWQTLKEFGGGALNNYGSHLLDQALELVETDGAEIFSDLRNILSLGNTEDQIKILLRSKGGCLLDLEILPNAAYPQDTWLVTGTSGTLRGTTQELAWKYVDWSAHPERSASRGAVADRAYPSEQLDWKEDSWSGPPDFKETVSQFYADFYKAVRHEQPMRVTPESALKLIDLIETIRKAER